MKVRCNQTINRKCLSKFCLHYDWHEWYDSCLYRCNRNLDVKCIEEFQYLMKEALSDK